MLLKEHKVLKTAIVELPEKEKDKLLLRLIAKDKVLTEHLHFKLLEDESDLEQRSVQLKAEMDEAGAVFAQDPKLSSKDVLTTFRKLNGRINHHFKVTKDISSEVELRIYLLNCIPVLCKESVFSSLHKFQEKLITYFVRTTLSAVNKYTKLHEDLQFDLKDGLNNVLNKIYTGKMAAAAQELKLPKEF